MEVLYCFGGGAARRVGIQVNLKILDSPSRRRRSLRMSAPPPKSSSGTRIPATQASIPGFPNLDSTKIFNQLIRFLENDTLF